MTNAMHREKIFPQKSSFIQFKLSQDSAPRTDLVKVSQLDESPPKTVIKGYIRSKLASHILTPIDYSKVIDSGPPTILGTISSLELAQQKGSIRNGIKTHTNEKEEREYIEEVNLRSQAPDIRESIRHDSVTVWKKANQYRDTGANLSIGTRDSIILRQSSMAKQGARKFSITPRDSIEVAKDATTALLRKPSSKMLSTKDSLVMLRDPKPQEIEEVCVLCHQKTNSPNAVPPDKDYCCDRCVKRQSVDVFSSPPSGRKTDDDKDKEYQQKQITITHVEVIDVEPSAVTNVAFKSKLVDIVPEPFHPTELAKMYKPSKKNKGKKRRAFVEPHETFFTPSARIEGDTDTNESLQTNDQFTKDRVHSFVRLMDDHPHLIKLFTRCQQ